MQPAKSSPRKLFLLGPPRVERDGRPVSLSRHKALALLAYLALTGQPQRRDTLATLFWPESDQQQARAGLRRVLAALKKELGPGWLQVQGEEVGLQPGADIWVDADVFYARLAACRAHEHPAETSCPACLAMLADAAALYRGPLLSGFGLRDCPEWDDWQLLEGQRLHDALAGALTRLAEGHAAGGELEQALTYARRWLALDPLHEPAHARLIELYARAGQRAAALRQYAECERVLEQELGVPPSPETTALARRVREGAAPPVAGGGEAPARRKHNLPAQITPFVGRQAVLADLAARLQDPACRLITLLGPGGSGKTRLALEVASRHVDRFADGVFLVSLAAAERAEDMLPAIAYATGLSLHPGDAQRQVNDWLAPKEMLLVLDNVEQLLAGLGGEQEKCAGVLVDILQAAPRVQAMITSRARLGVQGEYLLAVTGMDIPPAGAADALRYGAIQLFLTAARRTQPRFEPDAADLAYMIRVCHLVDGLPLAILLAAAWMEVLTPAEIAAALESQMDGRGLDFLATGGHDLPDRQRSMRVVFDASWRLLTPREQEVLGALSVFEGGFGRAAAEKVAGVSLRELMALVEKSMLQRLPSPPVPTGETRPPPQSARTALLGVEGRYEVHGLLRQYAAEKLSLTADGGAAVRERHSAYYTGALAGWAADLKGPRQRAALQAMEADLGNASAAWEWALAQGRTDRLVAAVDGWGLFYDWHARYVEAETLFAAAAALARPERAWARVLVWHAYFARRLGDTGLAREQLGRARALLDHPALSGGETHAERAWMLQVEGEIAYWSEDRVLAREAFAESLALYRALGERWGVAGALSALGMATQGVGGYEEARRLHEESLSLRRALGDRRGTADSLLWLAFALQDLGELKEGERLERESMAISREIGDRDTTARGLFCLAFNLALQGRFADAQALGNECVAIRDTLGTRVQMDNILNVLGVVEMSMGRYDAARDWLEMGLAGNRELDDRWGVGHALMALGELALASGQPAAARRRLAESASTFEAGQHRAPTSSALALLAVAAELLDDPQEARRCMGRALEIMAEVRSYAWVIPVLPAAALLLCRRGEVERGIEVQALAWRQPGVAQARYWQDIVGTAMAQAAAALPSETVEAARARGAVRDLWATVEELRGIFNE